MNTGKEDRKLRIFSHAQSVSPVCYLLQIFETTSKDSIINGNSVINTGDMDD